MPFVPMVHARTVIETRHSRALVDRIDQVVHEYRRRHPDLTDAEVRAALTASIQRLPSTQEENRNERIAIAVVVSIVTAFIGVAVATGMSKESGSGVIVAILGGVAAIIAVLVGAIRIITRD